MRLKEALNLIEEQSKLRTEKFSKAIDELLAKKLAAPDSEKKKIEVLRDSIDEIERSLESGVSIRSMVELLADDGVHMSIGTFKTMLHRIRKERQENKK